MFTVDGSQSILTNTVRPKIYADFHNADRCGRLCLDCIGTLEDISQQQIELCEGQALILYSDDLDEKGHLDELLVEGIVSFSEEDNCWVATIDWDAIRHASAAGYLHGRPQRKQG